MPIPPINIAAWASSLLVVGVCASATLIAIRASRRRGAGYRRDLIWRVACALAIGTGVWLADFLPALITQGAASDASSTLSLASMCLALIGAGGGLTAAIARPEPRARFAGGALFGMTLSAVHYLGLAASMSQGLTAFSPPFVAASLLIGASLGGAAMDLFRSTNRWNHYVFAGLFVVLGGWGLHFTAEAALGRHLPFGQAVVLSPRTIATLLAAAICLVSLAMVATIKLAIRSHAKALQELRETVDAMPAGMAFFDAQDRCTLWNAHFADHVATWGDVPVIGAPFRALLENSPSAKAHGGRWIEERLARHRDPDGPFEVAQGDRWFRIDERRTGKGGLISVSVDVTDLKRQAQTLADALAGAEAANQAKSRFLANISHELRTPLNGVLSVAKSLAGTRLDAGQREMLTLIDGSAATLSEVLLDLIEASAPEVGPAVLEVVALQELAEAASAKARAQCQAKGISFTLDVAQSARGAVQVDAAALRRALRILLDNAVKFTDRGGVSLRIARAPDRPEQVVLEVRDSGCGFDATQLERLFASFGQADDSLTRARGGMGLGLGICRRLVERMGGTLAADSRPGRDAVFWILLDLTAVEETASPPLIDQLSLLYAEDHPVNRKVMQYIMDAAGLDLTCVEDGLQAVKATRAQTYDLILMDMQMPVMDGLTAVRAIRAREAQAGMKPTPIIAVSAHGLSDHTAQSLAAGADMHLTKPIDAQRLLDAVAMLTSDAAPVARAA